MFILVSTSWGAALSLSSFKAWAGAFKWISFFKWCNIYTLAQTPKQPCEKWPHKSWSGANSQRKWTKRSIVINNWKHLWTLAFLSLCTQICDVFLLFRDVLKFFFDHTSFFFLPHSAQTFKCRFAVLFLFSRLSDSDSPSPLCAPLTFSTVNS